MPVADKEILVQRCDRASRWGPSSLTQAHPHGPGLPRHEPSVAMVIRASDMRELYSPRRVLLGFPSPLGELGDDAVDHEIHHSELDHT